MMDIDELIWVDLGIVCEPIQKSKQFSQKESPSCEGLSDEWLNGIGRREYREKMREVKRFRLII